MVYFLSEILTVTSALFIVFSGTLYLLVRYVYLHWERRGIKYIQPTFPFGNFGKSFMQKISNAEEMTEIYRKTKEPFIGTFGLFRPILFLRDPDLIRSVLIKDFQYFVNRGVHFDEKNDPLSAHLFSIEDDKWKNLRVKLSPTFTSGKLKSMFSTLVDCGSPLVKVMEKAAQSNDMIEIRDITARYSTNVIASVAFGLNTNTIEDPDTPFRKYGKKFFEVNLKNGFRFFGMFIFPKLLKLLRMRLIDQDIEDFMTHIVEQTLELREKNNIVRKDFFQLLVQLRNSGAVQLDDQWETVITNDDSKKLTIKELTAQAFVFYIAGFETSATTMSYCLYEIAKNQGIQRKVQEEIDTVLKRYDGKITYDSINEMKYLECCIDETLRKYPPAPTLNRECSKDYRIPGTNITLEKGTAIQVPIFAIQNDEKYFPNPQKFDPSRFFDENLKGKTFVDWPYMPFGEGPRNCIGLRMGKMQTKVGIVVMLQHFNYKLSDKHGDGELPFSPSTFILTPVGGINLKVSKRV